VLRLRTLGSVALEVDGRPLTGRSTQRRRLALLALLAVARERGMTRDKVLAFLWPERNAEHARHALSQTLYAVRQELGDEAVLVGVDDLRLNATVVASDIADFEDALAAGRHEEAVAAYCGAFLDGFFVSDAPEFERWVEVERQRLAQAYGTALATLAEAAAHGGEPGRAAEWWRKRAALEPLNSLVAARLMTALAQAGDRAGAIQHASVHASLLRHEMDVGPDPDVVALADRLRAELAAQPARPGRPATPPAAPQAAAAVVEGPAGPPPSASGVGRRRGRAAAIGAALAVVAVGGVIALARSHEPAPPIARPVVLGAVVGTEASLGLAVREALRAELESEGGIRVVGEARIRETLQLMRLPPDTALDAALAVEVAQRRGVPLAIVGSATPLGTGAQLVAQLLDAATGEPLTTLTERPGAAEEVVPAVARLAAALREHATGARVMGRPRPLPAVTTTSLAALRNYARAREALTRLDRDAAIVLLEAAIAHDSLFALAHYLVGDVLWYVDQYSHSVAHLTTALRLSDRLPARERLMVQARYEQLVRDRVDSALAYWQQLRATYPDEPMAYEGLVWTYLALNRPADVAAVAETALILNPRSPDMVRFRYIGLIQSGDTAGALRAARAGLAVLPVADVNARLILLEQRGEWGEALRVLDSLHPRLAGDRPNPQSADHRQVYLLALGRLDEAWREMETVVQTRGMQFPPLAWLFQAHSEVGWRGPTARAKWLVRRGLAWIESADIYPPAVARLSELAVTAAVRIGDAGAIATARRLVLARDAGRGLYSYRVALLTIDACAAFVQRDMPRAAALAGESRGATFHGHWRTPIQLLEADARAALGEHARADSLYGDLASTGSLWQPFAQRALGLAARRP